MVLVQRGHSWARGCCWAQPGSFRGAEQQAGARVVRGLGIANISVSLQCQLLPPVPARVGAWGPIRSPLPSGGCWWSCEATAFPALRRLLLAPMLLLHDRAGSTLTDPEQHAAAGRGAALHPSAPSARPPHTHPHPQPHRAPTHSPRPCSQHPAAITPASHGLGCGAMSVLAPLPGALPSSPSLLLLPSMAVGAEGSLPTLSFSLLARPPCSLIPRLGSAVARVWEQGTVPACQPCRRWDFGSRLPRSAAAAPAQLPAPPPPPADKAQPDKAAASLAGPRVRGQGMANPLLQPLAKPGRSPRLPVPGSGRGQRRAAAPRGRPWPGGRRDGQGGRGQPARG